MTAQIIDGKAIAAAKIDDLKTAIHSGKKQGLATPCLATILVGNNPASEVYVRNKIQACEKAGMLSQKHELNSDISENELCELIEKLNKNDKIHGILVQLPLPKHIDSSHIIETIDPKKDVDGFHPYNLGRLAQRKPLLRPCTPYGVIQLLETTGVNLSGKHAVIVGASNIVGRPMAFELLMKNCTVTVCHSSTEDLANHVKRADVLVSAVGKPGLIKGDWIKEGAIAIDIGITRLENGKLSGDIEFDIAKERAAFITPVPGGVGPMTVATLLQNTLSAAEFK